MQVKFTISPTLNSEGGVQSIRTPMLMLTKIQGMGWGAGPKAIDASCDGLVMRTLDQQGFRADLAEAITIALGPDSPQQYLVLMGLGTVQNFNPCGLGDVIDKAVDEALQKGCFKLTVPIVAHRLTALNINLRGTAHIVRRSVERKLAEVESDQQFEIEFVCTAQAKRHIQQGLDVVCQHRRERCCKGDKD